MPKRKPTKSALIKKADKVFSLYIRQRNSDHRGHTECFTCGKHDHWKKLQCGHFMSRRHYSTRWNETNCQVQCSACNVFRYGEQYKFSKNLDSKFGENTAEDLLILSNKTVHYDAADLLQLIEFYEKKISELK
jgi:5-methylcytosine-specific restriction endonuclease McrA